MNPGFNQDILTLIITKTDKRRQLDGQGGLTLRNHQFFLSTAYRYPSAVPK